MALNQQPPLHLWERLAAATEASIESAKAELEAIPKKGRVAHGLPQKWFWSSLPERQPVFWVTNRGCKPLPQGNGDVVAGAAMLQIPS